MSSQPEPLLPNEHTNGYRPEPDLVDRIAAALPADIRADYYCEMRHCRLLPENDEMLRILKIMQFLTLLMEQVPGRIAEEHERLRAMLAESFEAARKMQQANLAYIKSSKSALSSYPKPLNRASIPKRSRLESARAYASSLRRLECRKPPRCSW